ADFSSKTSVFAPDESREMLDRSMAGHRTEGNPAPVTRRTLVVGRRLAVAASLVAVILLSIYFYPFTDTGAHPTMGLAEAIKEADIVPGEGRATITLGDGRTLLLDE